MQTHLAYDLLAAVAAMAMTVIVYRWRLRAEPLPLAQAGGGYAAALIAGAVAGGYALGSLNLYLSGEPGAGRSILGALAGAILAVEAYKLRRGIRGSTGLVFVPAFCTAVVIGRWGCFLAGLDDFTHGTATALPWGHDFGDGIPRHPVQLYESAATAVFLAAALRALWRRSPLFLESGFHLMAGWYALQRFVWEFLKPYATVIGPLNLFHLVCIGLLAYSAFMIARARQ